MNAMIQGRKWSVQEAGNRQFVFPSIQVGIDYFTASSGLQPVLAAGRVEMGKWVSG